MSRFISNRFRDMAPYVPGEQPQGRPYIKLNTNESPYPPSPQAVEAVKRQAELLNLYPDPQADALTEALAGFYGLDRRQVLVGNGSDEVLAFAFQAFCDRRRGVVYPEISYGLYRVFAGLYGLKAREVPLAEDFALRVEDYFGAEGMVVIANPNAPTGLLLPLSDIERLLQHNPDRVVLVDEAYIDFGGESAARLIQDYDNLLVVQTFSKSRALAGGRLGLALGSPELIEDLAKIKYSFNPYSVNRCTLAAGVAAVEDRDYFEDCRRQIIDTREWAKRRYAQLGFAFTDSWANFLFVSHPSLPGPSYYLGLKARGVLVRYFGKRGIEHYSRVTIGTREQMERLFEATEALLKEAKEE